MNPSIHEGHRDPLPVLVVEGWIVENRQLQPTDAELITNPLDDGAGLVAQMAGRLADERYPCRRTLDHSHCLWPIPMAPSLARQRPAMGTLTCMPIEEDGQPSDWIAGDAVVLAEPEPLVEPEPRLLARSAAFFDVDNTMMRGSSLFHVAAGLAQHNFFTGRQIWGFGVKQLRFVLSGSEHLKDMASAISAALSFVEGREVDDLLALGEDIFDEVLVDKLIPGTLALAKGHLEAGQEVWLVTATPVELATLIARRLGLTGALGTVSEVENGRYTGRLVGNPLHGPAKAEAVRALAAREDLDLASCWAYSDSANDVPMLSLVGNPVAVNPDPTLRAHAREKGWQIKDFRRREQFRRAALPALSGAGGIVAGLALGYAMGRTARRGR